MEQQLAAINMQPDELEARIRYLETQCLEKEQMIRSLQQHLDEQVYIFRFIRLESISGGALWVLFLGVH